MGMADFYIRINFEESDLNKAKTIFDNLVINASYSSIFENNNIILIEGKFDNLIPTLILIFLVLSEYKTEKIIVESYGQKEKFDYTNIEDFIYYIVKANKDKLMAYYSELGFFSIDAKKYYKTRNKLKKFYTKMKIK